MKKAKDDYVIALNRQDTIDVICDFMNLTDELIETEEYQYEDKAITELMSTTIGLINKLIEHDGRKGETNIFDVYIEMLESIRKKNEKPSAGNMVVAGTGKTTGWE